MWVNECEEEHLHAACIELVLLWACVRVIWTLRTRGIYFWPAFIDFRAHFCGHVAWPCRKQQSRSTKQQAELNCKANHVHTQKRTLDDSVRETRERQKSDKKSRSAHLAPKYTRRGKKFSRTHTSSQASLLTLSSLCVYDDFSWWNPS